MKVIPISCFRKRMKEYFDYASNTRDVVIVTRNSDDRSIVIMSILEYNALKETEHLLSTKANQSRLEDSIKQMNESQTKSYHI